MISLLTLVFLINGFSVKWSLPLGILNTKMLVADTDRDGYYELIFNHFQYPYPSCLLFCEFHPPNTWIIDSITELIDPLPEAVGDFDADGLYDLLIMTCFSDPPPSNLGFVIFESPDSFSYPTQEVWRDTVVAQGLWFYNPMSVFDVDRDGIPEIFKNDCNGQPYWVWVYEAIGNNQYDTVFAFNPMTDTFPQDPNSTYAFGDFDEDGKVEFVMGDLSAQHLGAEFWVFESPANNTYEQIFTGYLPTRNITDCFTLPNGDGNAKLRFVVKGFCFDGRTHCFIFEAAGDNTYQIIKSFDLPNSMSWWYSGGFSDVGDVDGDGAPEITLEAALYVYLIKCVGNDSFYVWHTLYGHPDGSCVRVTNDFDHNGLNEIIISGNNYTRIYEKTPFVTWLFPSQYDTLWANDTVNLRWKLDETISLDSLKLYWAHPQLGCHLIYQGLPTDTICQWVVPDTQSNMSNKFWLVTKGFGRYDSTYSPVFYIKRAPGIEEIANPHSAFRIPHLEVYPNPFQKNLTIKFQIPKQKVASSQKSVASIKIYDISGRLVRQWDYQTIRQSDQIIWSGDNNFGQRVSNGVYFIHLETGNRILMKEKVIKLE